MEALTLLVAGAASILIWLATPAMAVVIFVAAITWYPQYLPVAIGGVDFNVTRILAAVLIVRVLTRPDLIRSFRVTWLDVFVVGALLAQSLSLLTNEPLSKVLVREGGTLFDTVLPYLAARFLIRTREDIYTVIKGLLIVAVPLALAGVYQSITGFNVYGMLEAMSPWREGGDSFMRKGFYRADGSFGNSIPFGLFFTAVFPLGIGLWQTREIPKNWLVPACGCVVLGALSSLSSGPLFALVACVGFLCFYRFRNYWMFVVGAVVAVIIAVELYSNRNFYHVLTRFAFSSQTGYYRIGLVEEALGGGMKGHWLFGYGYVGVDADPEATGWHWEHRDLVNIYVKVLARTGLIGFIPFLLLTIEYYRRLYLAGRYAPTPSDKWLVWCVAAAVVNWNVAMLTVSALSQTQTVLHLLYALCGALGFAWIRAEEETRDLQDEEDVVQAGARLRERVP